MGIVLVLLVLASGAAAGLTTFARQDRVDALREHSEPLADAAQDLYAALSIADASASTAFLSGGLQPVATVDRYDDAVATAASSLTAAATGAGLDNAEAQGLITTISARLPVYTGLVATADANNRAGNPVGVAYLGEASAMMQGELLPRAERLYSEQAAAVSSTQRRNAETDWIPLVVSAAAVAALIAAQVYLTRTNHRRLNPGLAAATAAIAVIFLWSLAAGLVAARSSDRAYHEGTAPLRELTSARITGQQARADETRSLMRRSADVAITTPFGERAYTMETSIKQVGDGEGMSEALDELDAWRLTHAEMRGRLADGDYEQAVAVAIGGSGGASGSEGPGGSGGAASIGPAGSSAEHFAALDGHLERSIASVRAHGRELTASSADATRFLVVGTGILAGLAAAAVVLGLWPRVSEYR